MTETELIKYHFDNYTGVVSDPKIHSKYWITRFRDYTKDELIEVYDDLMQKVGSWNSNQTGCIDACTKTLNAKYPNWRNR